MANYIDVVKQVMRDHPEVDCSGEERGKIVDYVCQYLNPKGQNKPFGRKSRNKEGTDLNEDGLTELLSDGKFFIYDIILGADPFPDEKDPRHNDPSRFATWDTYGPFAQGENGYWVPVKDSTEPNGTEPPIDNSTKEIDELKALIKEVQQENAFIKLELLERIKYGDFIALQTGKGFYFCAEHEGQDEDKLNSSVQYRGNVNASRKNVGPWETFKLVKP